MATSAAARCIGGGAAICGTRAAGARAVVSEGSGILGGWRL